MHLKKIKKLNKNDKCIQQNFQIYNLNEKQKIKLKQFKILKNKRYTSIIMILT